MALTAYKYNEVVRLTKNFRSTEFKCKGKGHIHQTLINLDLVSFVQEFMDEYAITKGNISSGYRCVKHSLEVGSTRMSKHTTEGAIDICFFDKFGKKIPSIQICCIAQDFGFKGIARIDEYYVHLDMRTGKKWYGDETKGNSYTIPTGDFYSYFNIVKEDKNDNACKKLQHVLNEEYETNLVEDGYFGVETEKACDKHQLYKGSKAKKHVKWLQKRLIELGYTCGKKGIDGNFGKDTLASIKKFQKDHNLKVDGYVGKDTHSKLI